MIQTSECPRAHTFSAPPKRVRNPLSSPIFPRLTAMKRRCCDCYDDKSYMGSESTDVHDKSELTDSIPKPMG